MSHINETSPSFSPLYPHDLDQTSRRKKEKGKGEKEEEDGKKRTARKDGIKSALEKTIPRERLHKRGHIKGVCTRTYMHACAIKKERERERGEGVADPPGGAIVPSSL